jgi:hypothetical protein
MPQKSRPASYGDPERIVGTGYDPPGSYEHGMADPRRLDRSGSKACEVKSGLFHNWRTKPVAMPLEQSSGQECPLHIGSRCLWLRTILAFPAWHAVEVRVTTNRDTPHGACARQRAPSYG